MYDTEILEISCCTDVDGAADERFYSRLMHLSFGTFSSKDTCQFGPAVIKFYSISLSKFAAFVCKLMYS